MTLISPMPFDVFRIKLAWTMDKTQDLNEKYIVPKFIVQKYLVKKFCLMRKYLITCLF